MKSSSSLLAGLNYVMILECSPTMSPTVSRVFAIITFYISFCAVVTSAERADRNLKSRFLILLQFRAVRIDLLSVGLKWYNGKVTSLFVTQTNLAGHCPSWLYP